MRLLDVIPYGRKFQQILTKTSTIRVNRSYNLSSFLKFMQEKGWYKVSANVAMQLYDKNSAISDSVDTIIESAKDIVPAIKINDKYVYEHEVLKLLSQPNKNQTYHEFLESALMYKLLTGNIFISAFGNIRAIPGEMFVTPTEYVVSNGTGFNYTMNIYASEAINYLNKEYTNDPKTGRLIASNMAELFHVKRFINYTTTNGYIANSIIDSIIYETEILNNGNNHNLSLLLNGVNLSGVFSIDTQDQKVVDQFHQDAQAYFGGPGNAGKFMATKGKAIDFKPMQMTNKEMEALGNSENVRKVIYDRFQIPSPLRSLGTETYSNYETAQYVLYDKAVIPHINSFYMGLTGAFRKRGILKDNESISYDPMSIPAMQTRFLSETKTKKEIGVYTNNEIRKMLGEDSMGPANDVLYQQGTLVPVGSGSLESNQEAINKFANILRANGRTEEQIKEMVRQTYGPIVAE